MSETDLPSAEEALASLRACGDQFATAPLAPQPLGMTFVHPWEGALEIGVDERVLSATGTLYVQDSMLATALQKRDAEVQSYEDALRMIRSHLKREPLVWGVSGYASAGPSCKVEASGLDELYGYFSQEEKPAFVVDGAAGAGVLGLNGVLGAMYNIPTVGITPLQGMSSMAPRSRTIVYGNSYQDREIVVATIPDILVCNGGRKGTRRECVRAIRSGGFVLLLDLRDDDPHSLGKTWKRYDTLTDAAKAGQLVVCKSLEDIRVKARRLSTFSRGTLQERRARRLGSLTRLLSP